MSAERTQLELLRALAELEPAPWVMGGYAEDALLAGTVTRPHADVDLLCPRAELQLRLGQLRALGFTELETWGEAAPGEPFYLYSSRGDVSIDLGVCDVADGHAEVRVHALTFEVGGRPAPAGYRFALPEDTFTHPPAALDGIPVRVVSPLALVQMRAGFAARGSFGPPSDRHPETARRLRERFFPDLAEAELTPRIEPL